MEKVYQVFVSSTSADLLDERRHVSETLAKAGYIPAGMELFPATDMKQLEYINRIIDRSDYYVVIVAAKYGSLADGDKSFTEMEFDYAVSKKIPVLAFLHKDPSKIEAGKTEPDRSKSKKLEAFRNKLKDSRIVDFWTDKSDLCKNVVIAVANQVNLTPGVGWVRGDNAIDPKLVQDFEKLRRENDELKKQLAGLNTSEVTFPGDLPSPDAKVDIAYTVLSRTRSAILETLDTNSLNIVRRISTTWKEIFLAAGDAILIGKQDKEVALTAVRALSRDTNISSVNEKDVVKIRIQLEALGLIKATHDVSVVYCSITDKGRQYLVHEKAIKRDKEA